MKLETSKEKRHTIFLSKIYGGSQDQAGNSAIRSHKGWLMALFIICSILLALSSCEEPMEDISSQEFVIRKGEYYASPRVFERFESRRLAFRAKFDESAIYHLGDPDAQTDKNVLMGFTDCSSLHDANSARFAWQWFNDRLDIYAYCYVGGTRVEEYITAVNLNEEYQYEIAITQGQYVFYLNGEERTAIERASICNDGANYILFPYFGGPEPAPHNVELEIEILD